jgi:hypothetical protein
MLSASPVAPSALRFHALWPTETAITYHTTEFLLTWIVVYITLVNPCTIAKCITRDTAMAATLVLLCFGTWFSGSHCTYILDSLQADRKESSCDI